MPISSTPSSSDDSDLASGAAGAVAGEIRLRTMPAAHCAALAGALDAAKPEDLDAREARLLAAVVGAADAVQRARTSVEKRGAPRVRVSATAFGNAWAAIGDVLAALARLPTRSGAEAQALHEVLFADGARFVKRDATAAWSEGRRRLDRLEAEGHRPALAGLIGAEAAGHLRSVTDGLGAAIEAKALAHSDVRPAVVREGVDRFAQAVGAYVRALAGKVDDESPAHQARFSRATAPLVEYRRARRKKIRDPRNGSEARQITEKQAGQPEPEAPTREPASPQQSVP
jgi:hypothetical protein